MNLYSATDGRRTWGELLEMSEVPKADEGELLDVNQQIDNG